MALRCLAVGPGRDPDRPSAHVPVSRLAMLPHAGEGGRGPRGCARSPCARPNWQNAIPPGNPAPSSDPGSLITSLWHFRCPAGHVFCAPAVVWWVGAAYLAFARMRVWRGPGASADYGGRVRPPPPGIRRRCMMSLMMSLMRSSRTRSKPKEAI